MMVSMRIHIQEVSLLEIKLLIYIGHAISQVPTYPEWYNVKYEATPAIYT